MTRRWNGSQLPARRPASFAAAMRVAVAASAIASTTFFAPTLAAQGTAGPPAPSTAEQVAVSEAPIATVALAGVRVFVDPATGAIIAQPTAEQVARLLGVVDPANWLRDRSDQGLRTFAVPGGIGVALEGRFTTSTVLRVSPDGTLELQCLDEHPAKSAAPSPTSSPTSPTPTVEIQ